MSDSDFDLDPDAAAYHQRLGISLDADLETIRSAGKFAYSKYHPDGNDDADTRDEYHRLKNARDALRTEDSREAYTTFFTEVDDPELATQLYEKWVMKNRPKTPSVWLSKQDTSSSSSSDSTSKSSFEDSSGDSEDDSSDGSTGDDRDESTGDNGYNSNYRRDSSDRKYYKLTKSEIEFVSDRIDDPTINRGRGEAEYDSVENTLIIKEGSEPLMVLDLDNAALRAKSASQSLVAGMNVYVERIRNSVSFSSESGKNVVVDLGGESTSESEDTSSEFNSYDTTGDWISDDGDEKWEDIDDEDADGESTDDDSSEFEHDYNSGEDSKDDTSGSQWGDDTVVYNDELVSFKAKIDSQELDEIRREASTAEIDEANFSTKGLTVTFDTARKRIQIDSYLDFPIFFDLTTGRLLSYEAESHSEVAELVEVDVKYDTGLNQLILDNSKKRLYIELGIGNVVDPSASASSRLTSRVLRGAKNTVGMLYRWASYPFYVYSTKYPEVYRETSSQQPYVRNFAYFWLWAVLMFILGSVEPSLMLLGGLLIAPLPMLSFSFHIFTYALFYDQVAFDNMVFVSFLVAIIYLVSKYLIEWGVKPLAARVGDLLM